MVVIVDEVDQLARHEGGAAARDLLNHLEAVRREPHASGPTIGLLAAAGVGALLLQHVLGSAFVSRATRLTLRAREVAWIAECAAPFEDTGRALDAELLGVLRAASGGVPALVTFLLQRLWDAERPGLEHLRDAISVFRAHHRPFVDDVRQSVSSPALDDRPWRLFRALELAREGLPRAQALAMLQGRPPLNLRDVLELLEAAGLLVVDDPDAQTLTARITLAPLWAMEDEADQGTGDFPSDLIAVTAALARNAPDLRWKGGLVPEATLSLLIGVGMEGRGWCFDRETQRGAGRTDLLLRRPGVQGEHVVEVKVWGRNDYRDVHAQALSYCSAATLGVAAVMLADGSPQGWTDTYAREVLTQEFEQLLTFSPLSAVLRRAGEAPDGSGHGVLHLLVQVARR